MASIGRFPSHDAPFCRPEAKPKDLTPATYSVSMARVWSFGEVLRLRLRTTERGKREADARVRTRMVDSGQAGYDGPVMNDLPIPDSRPPSSGLEKILARARELFARNGLKDSRSSLLSECSREKSNICFPREEIVLCCFSICFTGIDRRRVIFPFQTITL